MPLAVVAIAVLVGLPAIRLPLCLDDRWHRALLLHDTRWITWERGPLDLFTFADGSAEEHARIVETGYAAWWTSPELRVAFFRPLSSATHALDYALWPTSPALMHLCSIAWYAVVVALAVGLYRRILGRDGAAPWVAGLASLMYAVDVAHGIPVGWIANRNALCAAAFAFAALHAWDRRRPLVAAGLFGLALGCGESAVAALAFFAAHAITLDERPLARRLRALAPVLGVAVAYGVAHRAGRFGVEGSGVYLSPLAHPLSFAARAIERMPLLAGAELGAPTPDAYPLLPPFAKTALLVMAVVAVALAAVGFARVRASRAARFFALGGVLALVPSCATFPSGRLLTIAGFGLIGLLATIAASSGSRLVRGYVVWAVGVRLALSPLLMVLTEGSMNMVEANVERLAAGIPNDPAVEEKRLVMVTTADAAFSYYVVAARVERGEPVPRKMLVMAGGNRDVRVTRESERSLIVHADEGFYRRGTDIMFRSLDEPMPVGTRIVQSDVTVTVTHTLRDGVPDEARFELDRPLEDEHWLFVAYDGETLAPLALPAIGETRAFAGAPTPLF